MNETPITDRPQNKGYWLILMMNREAQWVLVSRHKDEAKARKAFRTEPKGYAFQLWNCTGPKSLLVSEKGDKTYLVIG